VFSYRSAVGKRQNTAGNVVFLHVGPARLQGTPKLKSAVFDGSVYDATCVRKAGRSRVQTSAIELQDSPSVGCMKISNI
jgi:hypothetical protein